jgi:Protein of unknown function (DUF3305)
VRDVEKPTKTLAVIMRRRETRGRWDSVSWEPISVLESDEPAGAPRLLVAQAGDQQWLYPGHELVIHRDEIEGYYMNVSSDTPRVFVLWRMDEEAGRGLPLQLTVSYDEGGRWLDGGHSVDSVPMPPEVFGWLGEYVEKNYRPEPKKRIKPRSFLHPKYRAGR